MNKKFTIFLLFLNILNCYSQNNYSSRVVSYDDGGNITYITGGDNSSVNENYKKQLAIMDFLEPGFPVQVMHTAGTYHGGPAVNTLVANIVGDNKLEIIVSGLSTGPLYAFNSSGQLLTGWPVMTVHGGAAYPCFINNFVITANWGSCSPCNADIAAFNGAGVQQWTHVVSNYVTSPPSGRFLTSISGYGVFNEEEDFKLHGYNISNGNILSGWPYNGGQSQEYHTPAIADIDNDGQMEIISASSTGNNMFKLIAVHENGTVVTGWNNILYEGHVDTYPVIGDVDGDGQKEIIVVTSSGSNNYVKLLRPDGTEKRSWQIQGIIPYGTAPALADLNGDGIPEIIIQTEGFINVTDGFGVSLPGWPKAVSGWMGNSSPVVGDVNGDHQPDIVFITQVAGSSVNGYVHVLDKFGNYIPGWPVGGMSLPIGSGAVPAIADIYQTGHNIIIITGSYWNGVPGNYDKVWAFDIDRDSANITDGPIEWGQFNHDAQHTGTYTSPLTGITSHNNNVPAKFRLEQNYPNPFNPNTKIRFNIPTPLSPPFIQRGEGEAWGFITLKVYDILGKEITTLINEELKPGTYSVAWDASEYPSGVYYYKLVVGDNTNNGIFSETKKMVLIK